MIRPGSKPKRPRGTGKASEARSKESKDGAEGAEEPATSSSSKKRKLNEDELKEREKRTVFVGNVPLKWTDHAVTVLDECCDLLGLIAHIASEAQHANRREQHEDAQSIQDDALDIIDLIYEGDLQQDQLPEPKVTSPNFEINEIFHLLQKEASDGASTPSEMLHLARFLWSTGRKQLRAAIRKALGDAYDGTLKPMWFRSLPLDSQWTKTAKMRKAGRILNDFADGAESKNAYVVVRSPEDVPLIVKKINNLQADMDHILRADGVGESAVLKKFDRKRSVFIGSLPRRVTESDIRWILWEAGEVDAVRIVRDKVTQECKGFAFARFKERKSVKAALSLWDLRIHGKYVRITKVDEEMEKAASTPSARPKVNPEKEKRIMLKQQRQQRVKAKKQREFVEQAKAAGLRTSKKPPKTVKRKLKDKKKAKR
eukprot:symbB.v1.2.036144.t2/scaffold5034.1/size31624/3